MKIADERITLTWDKLLTGEIRAAVATQEAAGLLPPGTSAQVDAGSLSLTKTEVAAIVVARASLGQLNATAVTAHVVKVDWEDDPPEFALTGLKGNGDGSPADPPADRAKGFVDTVATSIFR